VHIAMAVAEVCKGLVANSESMWDDFKKDYEIKAQSLFKNLSLKYDESEDGIISSDEEEDVVVAPLTAGRR